MRQLTECQWHERERNEWRNGTNINNMSINRENTNDL